MIPIAGFVPDADPTTPGILTDCENLVPTLTGMAGGQSAVAPSGVPVLAAACLGSAVVTKLDGTRRLFAGTQTAIYELVGTSWTDRTRVSAYTGGAESLWSIAQFGDATIMANRTDAMQRSVTGAFADIATAPKAAIVFSVGAFAMAMNVNDGADKPDGWHCCAANNDTLWTPSIATQATSGRLVSSPGHITAGGRMGDMAIAYKKNAIYVGQYVGSPVVWDFAQVPGGSAGCVGQRAWCDLDGTHFLVGDDNFWLFDGSRPTPIADGVLRNWFAANCSAQYKYKTQCAYDKTSGLVWVLYVSANESTLDSALVYHVQSKRWGRANIRIQCSLEYVSAGMTIDGLDALSATIGGLPDVPFDSAYWNSGGRSFAIFDTANQLKTLSGASTSSSMTTGNVGDDGIVSLLQEIRLRYMVAPSAATAQTFYMQNSGTAFILGPSGTLHDGKFNALKRARWHKARFAFTGPVSVTGMSAKYKQVAKR